MRKRKIISSGLTFVAEWRSAVRDRNDPSSSIARFLDRLGAELRFWSLLHAVFLAISTLAGLFWASLAIDYVADRWLELGPNSRQLLSLFWLVAATLTFIIPIVRRLVALPSRKALAAWTEERHPKLADRLLTSVELQEPNPAHSPALLQYTRRQAAKILATISPSSMLDRRPAYRALAVTLASVASLMLFFFLAPSLASLWRDRVLLGKDLLYPRRYALEVVPAKNVVKVARGRDHEVIVVASPGKPTPDRALLNVKHESSGNRLRLPLTRVGERRFRHTFRNLLEPVTFRAVGGDARTGWFHLQPVEPPHFKAVTGEIVPPSYTQRSTEPFTFAGAPVAVPWGSTVHVQWVTSKPASAFHVLEKTTAIPTTSLGETTFRATWRAEQSTRWEATFIDSDDIALEAPLIVDLAVIPDKAPTIEVSAPGISGAVTPSALLPMQVKAADDYGISKIEWEVTINDKPPTRIALKDLSPHSPLIEESIPFDLSSLRVAAGEKITLRALAIDGKEPSSQSTASDPIYWDVVTPEELLARLTKRELQFRERFEQVLAELKELHEAIPSMASSPPTDTDTQATARRLGVERALALLRKGQAETSSLAEGFAGILTEIEQNRIGTPVLMQRLGQQVIEPLRGIVQTTFPRALFPFEELSRQAESPDFPQQLTRADQELIPLIAQYESILAAMLKRESFQQIVRALQTLIDEQEKVRQATQERRKKSLIDDLRE